MRKAADTYRRRWLTLLVLPVWSLLPLMGLGQGISYKAQSLYLYKFTRYVTWPDQRNSGNAVFSDSLVIGVYGNSPILEELQLMAALKRGGGGRRIVIREVQGDADLENLHILYITSSKSRELTSIKERVGKEATLIVAERGGLARKGACINFMVTENDILRFEYNPQELQTHNLRVDEELLRLGYEVR